MESSDLDEFLEAAWNLKMAVEKLHPGAKLELRVDRLSKRLLEYEVSARQFGVGVQVAIDTSVGGRVTSLFGMDFKEIE